VADLGGRLPHLYGDLTAIRTEIHEIQKICAKLEATSATRSISQSEILKVA